MSVGAVALRLVLRGHTRLQIPHMTWVEIRAVKRLLCRFESPRILEYGTGFSTVHFPQYLRRQGRKFEFHSVDTSARWNEHVTHLVRVHGLEEHVRLYHEPDADAFASLPARICGSFDFILVDGRHRRRCLQAALPLVKQQGVVFLHDAQREYYHSALTAYPHGAFHDGGSFYPLESSKHLYWIGSRQPLSTGQAK